MQWDPLHCGGFQFLLILDLRGISFHAVIVFGVDKNLLFKSVLGHCVDLTWQHASFEVCSHTSFSMSSSGSFTNLETTNL